jgi:hypothetical protein
VHDEKTFFCSEKDQSHQNVPDTKRDKNKCAARQPLALPRVSPFLYDTWRAFLESSRLLVPTYMTTSGAPEGAEPTAMLLTTARVRQCAARGVLKEANFRISL